MRLTGIYIYAHSNILSFSPLTTTQYKSSLGQQQILTSDDKTDKTFNILHQ